MSDTLHKHKAQQKCDSQAMFSPCAVPLTTSRIESWAGACTAFWCGRGKSLCPGSTTAVKVAPRSNACAARTSDAGGSFPRLGLMSPCPTQPSHSGSTPLRSSSNLRGAGSRRMLWVTMSLRPWRPRSSSGPGMWPLLRAGSMRRLPIQESSEGTPGGCGATG